jgi:hypothetical protein
LKLEDIRSSLYVAAARRQQRTGRVQGDRVPRYAKLLQGALTLCGLLLVLWLPPLLFSQGAPTYTIPTITSVSINLTVTSPGVRVEPRTAAILAIVTVIALVI